ncbi:MFS transporter [Pseudonocardia asaccharolytica]|uniref:MFS transporter n=1 Tax=Pseudonocardia asaccharolytica DSM 44247 = NBRC 16224 TaxID=1123024 RepID=A0A511D5U3_9PSEU|nr:MFS transporter [Pseudonocardia asaccharolytica]GEL20166.1 MFS transporter [Pseudonocardia asaccharolytica DSM 44247 = NBRC 16224]
MADSAHPRFHPAVVIGVLASCGIAVSLVQTLVIPLLPRFPQLLSTTPATVSWLVTATLVAGAVSAPVLGRLGDMYGKRRILLIALGLITAGSALGAAAPNVLVLLVGRALQGASFGVIALGLSIMRDELPAGRVGSGVGLMSSSLGIGGAIGLPLAGVVAQTMSWRWLFAALAVLGVAQYLLVRWIVPESPHRPGGRFDLPGTIGLGLGLVCLLLAISKGPEWGWTSPTIVGLLVATAVVLPLWGRHELGRESPLVDLRVSARPAVLWTNLATVLVGFAIFASFIMTTQILQAAPATGYGFGLSLVMAGVMLLPMGAAMTIFSPASARLSSRRGPRTTLVVGGSVLAAGNIGFALRPPTLPWVVVATTVIAVGAALAYSALPLLIMRAVPSSETAAANSLNTLMRQLGTSVCSAGVAAVATALTVAVDGIDQPAPVAYTVIFLAAALAAALATMIAALTPGPTTAGTAPEAAVAQAGLGPRR